MRRAGAARFRSGLIGSDLSRGKVGRGRCPRHEGIALPVHVDSNRAVGAIATEISHVIQRRCNGTQRRRNLGNVNVLRASERRLFDPGCRRKVGRGCRTRQVNVEASVDRNVGRMLVSAAPKISREGQDRINHQFA